MNENEKYLYTSADDIVFDRRNKNYGGYVLRKKIKGNTWKGLIIAFIATILFALSFFINFSFLHNSHQPTEVQTEVTLADDLMLDNLLQEKLPPPPAAEIKSSDDFAEIEIKDKTEDKKNIDNHTDESSDTNTPGSPDGDAKSTNDNADNTGGDKGTGKTIYVKVEKEPIFPGGSMGLSKYLRDNVSYPLVARQNTITGTVIVRFVVNENGSVSDVSIAKGIGGGCDEEALRVVKAMPLWQPAIQQGHPAAVWMKLPIQFKLN